MITTRWALMRWLTRLSSLLATALLGTAVLTAGIARGDNLALLESTLPLPSLGPMPKANAPQAEPRGILWYQIYAVGSTAAGWEHIKPEQTQTRLSHGGTVQIAIYQYGYGNNTATALGTRPGGHRERHALCGNISRPHFCRAGEVILGYATVFTFEPGNLGRFSSSAFSVMTPRGRWQDSLLIR